LQKALAGGVSLHLTPKEFALLALLARHADEVLGRRQIARQVWNLEFDGGSNVVR
jgi:two-component system, OmpR family, copper resistance phosphate regulon response regulator CusR